MTSLRSIGLVSIIVLSPLFLFTLLRLLQFMRQTWTSKSFKKQMMLHVMLLLTVAVDLPLFIGFIVNNAYTLLTYSFHRLESVWLAIALSMTLRDWATLLYDIKEYHWYHFFIRKATLVSINILNILIALTNFILCFVYQELEEYVNSVEYLIGFFFQIFLLLMLTIFMLSAGLKLAYRIHGAAGLSDSSHHRQQCRSQQLDSVLAAAKQRFNGQVSEFRYALFNLNIVMATCCLCLTMQATLLIMDYALDLADKTNKTVGPTWFYWSCYLWIPLWGVVLSLSYLSRSRPMKRRKEEINTRLLNEHESENQTNFEDRNDSANSFDAPERSGYQPPALKQHNAHEHMSTDAIMTHNGRSFEEVAVITSDIMRPVSANDEEQGPRQSDTSDMPRAKGSSDSDPDTMVSDPKGRGNDTLMRVWLGGRTLSSNTNDSPRTDDRAVSYEVPRLLIGSFDSSAASEASPAARTGYSQDFGGISSIVSETDDHLYDRSFSIDNSVNYHIQDGTVSGHVD